MQVPVEYLALNLISFKMVLLVRNIMVATHPPKENHNNEK